MSRNYELLRLGNAQDVLQPEVGAPVPPPEVSNPVPLLQIDGMEKEEITKLVHRLFLSGGAEGPRHVVFTCTEPGSGNTWMCARAADILSTQVGNSVCLVDCNFRSPGLHQQFGIENHFGLADALRGEGPIRQYARQLRGNLWMVSCGALDDNANELLTSDRMRARFAELTAEFDYLLVDVAPLNICNHGMVLGRLSDGVALVLKANSTRRDAARRALLELQVAKTPILGAVLNQRTFPIPNKIYHRI
jgi:Mrp family chromosome partitioning ATPase